MFFLLTPKAANSNCFFALYSQFYVRSRPDVYDPPHERGVEICRLPAQAILGGSLFVHARMQPLCNLGALLTEGRLGF